MMLSAAAQRKHLSKLLSLLDQATVEDGPLIAERLRDMVGAAAAVDPADASSIKTEAVLAAYPHLTSRRWHARLTASLCLEAVAAASPLAGLQRGAGTPVTKLRDTWLRLQDVDVPSFHRHGTPLRSKAPRELVEEQPEEGGLEVRLRRQRKQLLQCLGQLDEQDANTPHHVSLYGGVAALIVPDDIAVDAVVKPGECQRQQRQQSAVEPVAGLLQQRGIGADGSGGGSSGGGTAPAMAVRTSFSAMSCPDAVAASTSTQELLLLLANDLVFQLFSQAWEARHGAAVGLLALLRAWGQAIPQQQVDFISAWAEDIATVSMCVLLLDRFGDYGGGVGVVAPIRESAAQVLGLAATLLPPPRLAVLVQKLHDMRVCGLPTSVGAGASATAPSAAGKSVDAGTEYTSEAWEARHGAQLGLLYLASLISKTSAFASRAQAVQLQAKLFGMALPGLSDPSEDVCASAAKALCVLLTAREHDHQGPTQVQTQVHLALQAACNALQHVEHDGMSASIADLMLLLITCTCGSSSPTTGAAAGAGAEPQLATSQLLAAIAYDLMPRLLSVWEHASAAVRASAAQVAAKVVEALLSNSGSDSTLDHVHWAADTVLRRCMWGMLCEPDVQASDACLVAWNAVVPCLPPVTISMPIWGALLDLYLTPDGQQAPAIIHSGDDTSPRPSKARRLGHVDSASAGASMPTSNRGAGVTYASRVRACEALSRLLLQCCSDAAAAAVARIAAEARSAVWSCQREASLLLLAACSPLWHGGDQQPAVVELATSVLLTQHTPPPAEQQLGGTTDAHLAELLPLHEYIGHAQACQLATYLEPGAGTDVANSTGAHTAAAWGSRIAQGQQRLANLERELQLRRMCAAAKCAVVAFAPGLPAQLNPVLRPLMDAIKVEPGHDRRSAAADTIVTLVASLCTSGSVPHLSAFNKLLGNILNFVAAPSTADHPYRQLGASQLVASLEDFLQQEQPGSQVAMDALRQWFMLSLLPLTEPKASTSSAAGAAATPMSPEAQALALLSALLFTSSEHNPSKRLASCLLNRLQGTHVVAALLQLARGQVAGQQDLADSALSVLARIGHLDLLPVWPELEMGLLPPIFFSKADTATAPGAIDQRVRDVHVLAHVLQQLPKAVSVSHATLALPVLLRCATDEECRVRHEVSGLFVQLVRHVALSPMASAQHPDATPELAGGAAVPQTVAALQQLALDGALIIRHLVRGQPLELLSLNTVPAAVRHAMPAGVNLRPYQWEGVTWCDFLRRTGTNGILADDMGLGKTLQALTACAICRTHRGTGAPPDLVVCPPTLLHHWQSEASRFFGPLFQETVVYAGSPSQRRQLASTLSKQALVITSYPVVQRDWEVLSQARWSYLVLDEAHLIRNPDSMAAAAVRALRSDHRIALTGTPIQNTVAELWSIFDLVMPGYLGARGDFRSSYVRPTRAVLEAGGRASDVQEVLKGMHVLDKLHRQVLPFVLRREKAQVLVDLPPKTVTVVGCHMPPRQRRFYEHLRRCMQEATGIAAGTAIHNKPEVFKWLTLQQLAGVHPGTAQGATATSAATMLLSDSCKLLALRQLLWDSGIGLRDADIGTDDGTLDGHRPAEPAAAADMRAPPGTDAASSPDEQRKCLLFAQHKVALDAAEQCLLRPHLPSVKYLRIDGSIAPASRAALLEQFANDGSISLLLLTTAVGGLGLNLTVADTAIFLEHSWNPQVDMQAMDRAHRIGQCRAVNVYRLVAIDTVDERILSLQAGKVATADKVVAAENAGLCSLGTDAVLQLFCESIGNASEGASIAASNRGWGGDDSDDDALGEQLEQEYGAFDPARFALSLLSDNG